LTYIKSRSNERIKLLSSLLAGKKARKKTGLFVLEGARLCADAADTLPIQEAYLTEKALDKYEPQAKKILAKASLAYIIDEEISSRISDTSASQGVFCVCKQSDVVKGPERPDPKGNYLALENIQDPANLGAVARTAEALGLDGLILDGGCDIFNPKALRAAMGSSLRIPITNTDDLEALLFEARAWGMLTVGLTPSGDPTALKKLRAEGGNICLVGNEGQGLSPAVLEACELRAAIPMKGRAESLNAAAAAAIIMWELVR
jgi:TrmH family RNA methyltransferase